MMIALVQGPPGGTLPRTQKALDVVNDHFLKDEKANVESVFTVSGFSFNGQGQSAGLAFVKLKDWAERGGSANKAAALAGRPMGPFPKYREEMTFALVTPHGPEVGKSEVRTVRNDGVRTASYRGRQHCYKK